MDELGKTIKLLANFETENKENEQFCNLISENLRKVSINSIKYKFKNESLTLIDSLSILIVNVDDFIVNIDFNTRNICKEKMNVTII
jgi:thiamine pyrophosphokinase